MEASFQIRYREGDKVFYVSTTINLGEEILVSRRLKKIGINTKKIIM
jgi:hypothetical protein